MSEPTSPHPERRTRCAGAVVIGPGGCDWFGPRGEWAAHYAQEHVAPEVRAAILAPLLAEINALCDTTTTERPYLRPSEVRAIAARAAGVVPDNPKEKQR